MMSTVMPVGWTRHLTDAGGRLLQRTGHRLFHERGCDVFTAQLLNRSPGWPRAAYWIGEVHPDRTAWLAALAPSQAHDFPHRWARGDRCFAIEFSAAQRCTGYVWFAIGRVYLPSRWGWTWDVPSQAAWLYDAFNRTPVRGAYAFLANYACAQLAREGFHRIYCYIDFANRRSRCVHQKLGFVRVGSILQLKRRGVRGRIEMHAGAFAWHPNRVPVRLADFLPESENPLPPVCVPKPAAPSTITKNAGTAPG